MTRIKICGITNMIDAINAVRLNVDMLGFVFYEKSKRYITSRTAVDIINELPPYIGKVGVFVDEPRDSVMDIADAAGLDTLQFHGDETDEYCKYFQGKFKIIKAFRLKDKKDLKKINSYNTDFYLLDTYRPDSIGGTGDVFDWKMLRDFEILKPVILSGGLGPDNVSDAIQEVAPYAVDVSTGVETEPGRKDLSLVKKFVENVRRAGL